MRRFFFDTSNRDGDIVVLSTEESRHLVKVLRSQLGDKVELLDGQGGVHDAVITLIDRRVELTIQKSIYQEAGLPTVRVYQGILKGEKMDTVVQKCTELGVTDMIAYQSSRCQGKLNAQQFKKKHERWQRIGLNACKQCLRAWPMQLDLPTTYENAVQRIGGEPQELRLLFWEEEKDRRLQDIADLGSTQSVGLLLGPEGGLSHVEVEMAREQGFTTVSLGKRILRAETATLSAVSIVQYLSGNL